MAQVVEADGLEFQLPHEPLELLVQAGGVDHPAHAALEDRVSVLPWLAGIVAMGLHSRAGRRDRVSCPTGGAGTHGTLAAGEQLRAAWQSDFRSFAEREA